MTEAKPVVVTRAESADGPLSSQLRSLGLPVLVWPAVAATASETDQLDTELGRIDQFDWIVFASRHAVAAVIERLPVRPPGLKVAAVGQATAQVLNQRGWNVDLVPDDANAAALVAAFQTRMAAVPTRSRDLDDVAPVQSPRDGVEVTCVGAPGPRDGADVTRVGAPAPRDGPEVTRVRAPSPRARVLFPASSRALPTIATGLSQLGAEVVQVEAYRTEAASLDVAECMSWVARDAIGAVTFASPSAVIELERSLGKENFERLLGAVPAVAIGPTTARELTERGRAPVLAEAATLQGLARTTHRLLGGQKAP